MITYKDSGVNIEEGYKTVDLIKSHVKKTHTSRVVNNIGSFAGMFDINDFCKNPILVSGTDGVGTKIEVAQQLDNFKTIGIDCLAMCANDILCHGAKPLFFLDYIACDQLNAETAADIVEGIANGCQSIDCALIGGETAEMPGVYRKQKYDLAGFCVGIVDKERIIDGSNIKDGDILIGLPSSGIHSNGFSLVRSIISDYSEKVNDQAIGDILLEPTKLYVSTVLDLIENFEIKGMAHITGGGLYENVPRMLPNNLMAVIEKSSIPTLPIYKYLLSKGLDEEEMYHTFNMGIGFVMCVDAHDSNRVLQYLTEHNEPAYKIGYVQTGGTNVCLI